MTVYPLWSDQYRALSEGMDFPVTDVNEAAAAVEAIVAWISSASRDLSGHARNATRRTRGAEVIGAG